MAMAMSIYRTLCVLVFFLLKISLLEMLIAFGNEHLKNSASVFDSVSQKKT